MDTESKEQNAKHSAASGELLQPTATEYCRRQEQALLRMQTIIPPLIEKYAPAMGVKPKRIVYQATISRWGCCQPATGQLAFSVYLLLLPQWCIEHVVVHELTHLLVPNHSKQFYAVMDRFFPRWKEARKETKRISSTT